MMGIVPAPCELTFHRHTEAMQIPNQFIASVGDHLPAGPFLLGVGTALKYTPSGPAVADDCHGFKPTTVG